MPVLVPERDFNIERERVMHYVINSLSVLSAVRATNVITVTHLGARNLIVGSTVVLSGFTPNSFDGTYLVATLPTLTSFTIANVGVNEPATVIGPVKANEQRTMKNIRPGRATPNLPHEQRWWLVTFTDLSDQWYKVVDRVVTPGAGP